MNAYHEFLTYLKGSPYVVVDTETTGLDPHLDEILLISLKVPGKEAKVIDVSKNKLPIQWFRTVSIPVVMHNATFDWKMFFKHGVEFKDVRCTLVIEQVLTSGLIYSGFSLDAIVLRRFNVMLDKTVRQSFIGMSSTQFSEEQLKYAAEDAEWTQQVYEDQMKEAKVKQLEIVLYEVEFPIIPAMAYMEYVGVNFNKDRLQEALQVVSRMSKDEADKLQMYFITEGLTDNILITPDSIVAVNPLSQTQMLAVYRAAGIEVNSLSKKELSDWDARHHKTEVDDEDDFSIGYSHPLIRKHAVVKALSKLESTYIQGLLDKIHPVTGHVHPRIMQCGATSTGRMSSNSPNIQNLPNHGKLSALNLGDYDIRSMIEARPGHSLLVADFSSIELVILALMSKDKKLLDQVFGDIHAYVANNLAHNDIIRLFGKPIDKQLRATNTSAKTIRDAFKPVSFGIVYGSTGYNLYRTLYLTLQQEGITITRQDADRWVEEWKHSLFPDTGAFLNANSNKAVTQRYTESVLGRKRFWPESVRFDKKEFHAAMREGSNQPIQASSADLTKYAVRLFWERANRDDMHIKFAVHDEIVVEVKDEVLEYGMRLIQTCMEDAGRILFPESPDKAIRAEIKSSKVYNK